jgi:hypothetical protein
LPTKSGQTDKPEQIGHKPAYTGSNGRGCQPEMREEEPG